MKKWMQDLNLVLNIQEVGVTEDMLEKIANQVNPSDNAYKALSANDVLEILRKSW